MALYNSPGLLYIDDYCAKEFGYNPDDPYGLRNDDSTVIYSDDNYVEALEILDDKLTDALNAISKLQSNISDLKIENEKLWNENNRLLNPFNLNRERRRIVANAISEMEFTVSDVGDNLIITIPKKI